MRPGRRAASGSLGGLSPIDDDGYMHDEAMGYDGDGGGLRFGDGALEDLLPSIQEGAFDTEPSAGDGSGRPGSSRRLSAALRSAGTGSRPTVGTAAYSLLETSGTQAQTQQPVAGKATRMVVEIFRRRLDAAPTAETNGDGDAAHPSTSFFELATGLRRPEAVKLFYQLLVTHSTAFVVAHQERPFGDIAITAGPNMPAHMH
ncbi:hypothetical protein FOA52_010803 [Chlamydomonas sp. UWO 241]|nr:hypothetical protein FOA52_010803 [Chlamydomonas sp. UWO 241]